jgi:hypothetical protein
MFVPNKNRPKRKTRRPVNISQHEFSKGYVSTIANARRPLNSFADLTNMEIVQDSIARPRASLMAYGTQMPYPIVGRGKFTQNRVRKEIFMLECFRCWKSLHPNRRWVYHFNRRKLHCERLDWILPVL